MAREKSAIGKAAPRAAAGKGLPASPGLGPQMRQFWESQQKILSEAEAFAQHWFARRHEAMRAALDACEQAAEANPTDATGALQAFRDWQSHSAERLAEDMREWVELCARCAGHVVSAEVDANTESLEELRRQTDSELHAHHATPV